MRPIFYLCFILFSICPAWAAATTYYVATDGNDDQAGTLTQPFRTIRHTVGIVTSGDTIYVRGGTYYPTQTIRITRADGTPSRRTSLLAFPGERPVLDGSKFTLRDPDVLDNDIFRIQAAYWHLRGLTLRKAIASGVQILGDGSVGNVLEALSIYENEDSGVNLLSGASQTLVLNCDSYRNFDPRNNGENADGFAAKFDVGPGNVFRNCRAWANSDDGYDFWRAGSAVTVESCYAYANGFDVWDYGSAFTGNGIGFKLGQQEGAHVLKNCVAWGNRVSGYDSNKNTTGVTLLNCVGYNNDRNFVIFGSPPHRLRNCVSLAGEELIVSTADDVQNSWTLPVTIDAADFKSLDDAVITGPRTTDDTLPDTDFLRLAAGSDLIDRGVDVGLPFAGSAPDLGAFELDASTAPTASNGVGRTEAEDMDLEGYETTERGGTSGGQVVQILATEGIGSVGYRFTGPTGTYDLAIRYLDENDGNSTFTLITNDVTTRQWTDDQTPEGASDEWRIQSVRGIRLNQDSRIEIQAGANRGAFARLDYVEVAAPNTITIRAQGETGEERMALIVNGKTVEEWPVTTTPADYSSLAKIDGDVRVAFLNDQVRRENGVRIDRNLRVDYLTVDGRRYEAEDQESNTGGWDRELRQCGRARTERLDCEGYIEFGQALVSESVPTTDDERGSESPSAELTSYLHRGNIIHNDRAVFPVGYWTGNSSVADKHSTLDALGPAGFDLLSYGVARAKSDSLIDFFARADDYGVRFIYGLFGGDVAISEDISPLQDWALQDLGRPIRENPALLGYYHSDDVRDILASELLKKDEVVKAADPDHLTFHSTGVATDQDSLIAYAASADVPGMQMYPAGGFFPHNVHFHTQRTVRAADRYGHSPMAIGQTHSLSEYFADDPTQTGRWPTPQETDVYTYLSLAAGAKSLFFFTYSETGGTRITNPGGLANYRPAIWEQTKVLKDEIRGLERMYLYGQRLTNEERSFTTYFGRWIYGDKVYVAAINSLIEGQPLPGTNTGVNAQSGRQPIAVPLPPGTRGPARPLFGRKNSLSVTDGQLAGTLDITSVEFYELDYTAPVVTNGDFSADFAGWQRFGDATITPEGDNKVLRANRATDASSVTADITHRILPGQTYTLSADVRGAAGSGVTVFVQLRDYRNQIITTQALEANTAETTGKSVTFTAPAEFGSVVVGVWRFPGGSGEAFIDNIQLTPPGTSTQLAPAQQLSTPAASSIDLYPNPASGEVTLRTELPRYALQLFDATGKLVLLREDMQYTTTLGVADLPTGFYTVRISHADGEYNRKLVIDR